MRLRAAALLLALAAAACSTAKANVRLDRRLALARPVQTVRLHPVGNTTGNEEAGRIVEAAIRHRIEFAGFRLVEPGLPGAAFLGEGAGAAADAEIRATLTLATDRADKVDWYWFPLAINPVGWVVIAADALIKNKVVALQVDAVVEQNGERTPVVAQGYIEQKDLEFMRGVNAVSQEIAVQIVDAVKTASDRAGG